MRVLCMRRRNGLMGFSLIGGSCLEVEVANSSILKTKRSPAISSQVDLYPLPSTRTRTLRGALSRGSGFGQWHHAQVFGAAAILSGFRGTLPLPSVQVARL